MSVTHTSDFNIHTDFTDKGQTKQHENRLSPLGPDNTVIRKI